MRHALVLTSISSVVEAGALRSRRLCCPTGSSLLRPPPTSRRAFLATSDSSPLYAQLPRGPGEISPVLCTICACMSFPIPRRSPLRCDSRVFPQSVAFANPFAARPPLLCVTRRQDSLDVTTCRLAASFLRPLHPASTQQSPTTPGICYGALWRLPRPDFHR